MLLVVVVVVVVVIEGLKGSSARGGDDVEDDAKGSAEEAEVEREGDEDEAVKGSSENWVVGCDDVVKEDVLAFREKGSSREGGKADVENNESEAKGSCDAGLNEEDEEGSTVVDEEDGKEKSL